MSEIFCSRCGAKNPEAAAFCNRCGTPIVAPPAAPAAGAVPGGQPPAGGYPAQSPAGYPPAAAKMGTNTMWAFGLAAACLLIGWFTVSFLAYVGPILGVGGAYMAKKDMDDFAAGRAPQLNGDMAKIAYYGCIGSAVLMLVLNLMVRGCRI